MTGAHPAAKPPFLCIPGRPLIRTGRRGRNDRQKIKAALIAVVLAAIVSRFDIKRYLELREM
jgi:hypothetical protein